MAFKILFILDSINCLPICFKRYMRSDKNALFLGMIVGKFALYVKKKRITR